VVGFYEDNYQPYVGHFKAEDAKLAAAAAKVEAENAGTQLSVVEVFDGHLQGKLANEEVI
jgi:hypothetical protein